MVAEAIHDEEERRELMEFVVDAYYDFIIALGNIKIISYSHQINTGDLMLKFKVLSGCFVHLFYLVNLGTKHLSEFDQLANVDIRKLKQKDAKKFISGVINLMEKYQSDLKKSGLLPLKPKQIEDPL